MALTTSGFQVPFGKFDTAGQIESPTDVMGSTQTLWKSNSQALEQSKVLLARPNLLNDADFESISQLPARELRKDWAGTYRKAHLAQQHQQDAWVKFAKFIGTTIDAGILINRHQDYLEEIQKYTKEITEMNKEIAKNIIKLKRDNQYGHLIATPFRGPQLEVLEKGKVEIRIVKNKKMGNKNKDNESKKKDEVNDADEEVLVNTEKKVSWDENLKHKNLGMINVPKGGFPAQKVYNASKFAQQIGSQDVEDVALESDQEVSDEDEPELATSMRDAPPPQVQALHAQLGGWDGPLTQYFQGQMEDPVRDRYEELIQPIDNAIAAQFDGPTVEGTVENHQAQLQNPFTSACSINKSLYMLTMGYKALWRDGTFNLILNGKSESKKKVASRKRIIHNIEDDVYEARFPENFVDAMIPPQMKHLCNNKESIPKMDQNLVSTSGTLLSKQDESGVLIASGDSNPDQTDVAMANDQNPGQSLTTNQASGQNAAINDQILEKTSSQYYDNIGGLNGYLRSYLSQASPKSKQNVSRKIKDLGNQFLKMCESHGIDVSSRVVTEEHLQIAEDMEKQFTAAKEVYLQKSGEESLRSLEKIQGEIRHLFPESLAIAIIGGGRNTRNNGWKNSRHNGWKDSNPLNNDSKNSTWDDYVISHSRDRGHGVKENITSNDSSPVMDEQEMYEKFKQFLKNSTGWA
ncbi:hypothetical protein EAF00_000402 [Botryotinia globosa]|nr:hypothetical protein EAF00_000402 [Botryotinia globosa]